MDGLQKQKGSLKEELLNSELPSDDIAAEAYSRLDKSSGDKVKSPEQWLKQINDLWVLGDQQAVKENLNQFCRLFKLPDRKGKSATISTAKSK